MGRRLSIGLAVITLTSGLFWGLMVWAHGFDPRSAGCRAMSAVCDLIDAGRVDVTLIVITAPRVTLAAPFILYGVGGAATLRLLERASAAPALHERVSWLWSSLALLAWPAALAIKMLLDWGRGVVDVIADALEA